SWAYVGSGTGPPPDHGYAVAEGHIIREEQGSERVLARVADAHLIAPLDENTVLIVTEPHPDTLTVNFYLLDLDTLEPEFVATTGFPPSRPDVHGSRIIWTERACGIVVGAQRTAVAHPGDVYRYDRTSGELTRFDASAVRDAGATALFVAPLGDGRLAIADSDRWGIRALIDGATMEPELVFPLPVRLRSPDGRYVAAGRAGDHGNRCSGGGNSFGPWSSVGWLADTMDLDLVQAHTPGSCLNLRETPSTEAEILDCTPDGTPLLVRDVDDERDGWVPVRTLDGDEGWVAEEFVEGGR
ncbi:MAG: SH3 domain-containing protein, partial [Myxococcota bacterium]